MLELSDAPAWLAGEDDEQLRWFAMPAASLPDVERAIERWRASWRDDGRANVCYVVFPAFRRHGYATAAVERAVAWGADHLAVDEFVAIIDERNVASLRVAEQAGFALDGPAEPWEHKEPGTMLRYLFSAPRS